MGQARQIALELALLGGALALAPVGGIQRAGSPHEPDRRTRVRAFRWSNGYWSARRDSARKRAMAAKLVAVQQHHREPAERQASEANGKRHDAPFLSFLSGKFTPEVCGKHGPNPPWFCLSL